MVWTLILKRILPLSMRLICFILNAVLWICFYGEIRVIRNKGLFERIFYCSQLKKRNISLGGVSPIIHYLIIGESLSVSPTPKISIKYSPYADKKLGRHGSVLFLIAKNEGCFQKVHSYAYELIRDSTLFDAKYYCEHLSPKEVTELANYENDPVEHYLHVGYKEHLNPSALFDNDDYIERMKLQGSINPLLHFLEERCSVCFKVQPRSVAYCKVLHSKLFDIDYYLEHNPDVRRAGIDPVQHYMDYGWIENRNPSKLMDNLFYKSLYKSNNPILDYEFSADKHERITNQEQSTVPADVLRIGVKEFGGLGDIFLDLNYIYSILDVLNEEHDNSTKLSGKIIFTIYSKYENSLFADEKIEVKKFISTRDYYENNDLCFDCFRLWIPVKYNLSKVITFSKRLHQLIESNLAIYQNVFKNKIQYELYQQFCRIMKIRRAQQMDPYNVFEVNLFAWSPFVDDSLCLFNDQKKCGIRCSNTSFINKNQSCCSDIIQKLKSCRYVTINRSASTDYPNHVKLWFKAYYDELVSLLKRNFPSLKVVQVGYHPSLNKERTKFDLEYVQEQIFIDNVDINLVNRTNISQLKLLLKNSCLHIDSEGGLVHLCHFLHTKCAVIFGPTDVYEFGYGENINIYDNLCCDHGCHWITENWQTQCINPERQVCMKNITPSVVMNKIASYLTSLFER